MKLLLNKLLQYKCIICVVYLFACFKSLGRELKTKTVFHMGNRVGPGFDSLLVDDVFGGIDDEILGE